MKIILGDNPLFHINHHSGPSSKKTPFSEQSPEILEAFLKQGGQAMMLSNSDHINQFLDYCQVKVDLKKLNFLFVIPAMNNMNERAAHSGLLGLFRFYLNQIRFSDIISSCKLSFNPIAIFQYLFLIVMIRVQIYSLTKRNLKIEYLCLHNVATDLLIGTRNAKKIKMWIRVCKLLGFKPLLITQNILKFESMNLTDDCAVCFSFNKNGYLVNPDLQRVSSFLEKGGKKTNREYFAMQILSGGANSPVEALKHCSKFQFDGILYATTKVERIDEFFSEIQT